MPTRYQLNQPTLPFMVDQLAPSKCYKHSYQCLFDKHQRLILHKFAVLTAIRHPPHTRACSVRLLRDLTGWIATSLNCIGRLQATAGAGCTTTTITRHTQFTPQVLQRQRASQRSFSYWTVSDSPADANVHENGSQLG